MECENLAKTRCRCCGREGRQETPAAHEVDIESFDTMPSPQLVRTSVKTVYLSRCLLVIISPQIDKNRFHILSKRAEGTYPTISPTFFGWSLLHTSGAGFWRAEEPAVGGRRPEGEEVKVTGNGQIAKIRGAPTFEPPRRLQQSHTTAHGVRLKNLDMDVAGRSARWE